MKKFSIISTQNSAVISSEINEFVMPDKPSCFEQSVKSQPTIGVAIDANAKSITVTTRPVAVAKALRTQRLNQSLELGYIQPVKSTI